MEYLDTFASTESCFLSSDGSVSRVVHWLVYVVAFCSPWRFLQVLSVRRSNELHDHRSCISHTIFTSGCMTTGICFFLLRPLLVLLTSSMWILR